MQRKIETLALLIIVIGAFLVRLYKIDAPLADWHSFRQSDTAAVSYIYLKQGIDLLKPRYFDISSIQSGKDNPNGYRMVEFPLYNAVITVLSKTIPSISLDEWGRLISIFASLGSTILLYLLVRKYYGAKTAVLTAFFFGFIPYNIFFSRTILPEPSMTFSFLGAIYFFDKYLDEEKTPNKFVWFFISALFSSIALLIKIMAVFFLLPVFYLAVRKFKVKVIIKPELWLYAIIAFVPIIIWRLWITNFPEGIPASSWLLNGGNIRFKGAFFRWIIAERLGKLILAYGGFVLFWLGLLVKQAKQGSGLFYSFIMSSLLYVIIFARGNVQHDYYQIPTIPSVAIFSALGAKFLWDKSNNLNTILSRTILVSLVLMMLAFGWYEIKGDFNINHPEIVKAGQLLDKVAPFDAKVIAPYEGDTAFLYQTKRQGWPLGGDIDDKISKGATYYVSTSFNQEAEDLSHKHQVIFKDNSFIIIKLQ